MTIADVGEFGLISKVTARMAMGPTCLLGPGDDGAVVAASDNRVVVSTDVLVEGRHFRRDWSSAEDVGHRAAAANLADIAAMGATPTALVVGLCAPPELPVSWAEGLADGLAAEAALAGASVVGGDTVASPTLTIAVTALGDLRGADPVTRAGAKPGDRVAVAGRLGWSAAGYTVLSRGFRSPRALVDAHRRPIVPYHCGPVAARQGATAMIDVSDGLVADLGHLVDASDVAIDLHRTDFEVPAQMADAATALGVDPYAWVFGGGEDHALVATFPPGSVLTPDWRVVGEVAAGHGVTIDGRPYTAGPGGWDHFR
ncbi:thiamine-phosphate kinase [Actinocatenispora rupis]|uniref:Thiamine-monophosphate kinase n=1 Tax=Actinocatenispora rupis TaxID=519421 RepID=A0A8J3JGC8_9ACTN|nr:thiamine-phosphate kinase [Actinocatenispora rupis]GID14373.1 thiamine-monophosphate kinase [Actinocatenispora rupis]